MPQPASEPSLRRDHPVFFWGIVSLIAVLIGASVVVASRVPAYRSDAARLDSQMSAAERATRDRILASRAKRSELALALLQRELRLRELEQKGLHLAIDTDSALLYLRHDRATLRRASVRIGPDSIVHAPDGRTWRFVRALGQRHVQEKQTSPTYTVPEWVYIGQGVPVPPEDQRQVPGGLGDYVLRLDDGTEIYSVPEAGPLRGQVKPAAFMVDESELQAIFDAVPAQTPVFIY